MSQTESLSRRYNHLHLRHPKTSKAPTIRLTASQLLGCKVLSLEGSIHQSSCIPNHRLRQHSYSQSHNNQTNKSQRKTQSVISKKKNQSNVSTMNRKPNNSNSKTNTKNHSRLQSQATTTIRNETVVNSDMSLMYERMKSVLERYKAKEEEWKKEKQNYESKIQYLVEKIKKGNGKGK